MTQKLIIFDFDGTIANSNQQIFSVVEEIIGGYFPQLDTKRFIEQNRDKSISEIIQNLKISKWLWPYLYLKAKYVFRKKEYTVNPFEGIQNVLINIQKLKNTKVILLSSASKRYVLDFWDRNSMPTLDSYHCGVGLFSKSKKIKSITNDFKFSPANIYYIGDEIRDAVASKEAGVNFIGVNWGFNSGSSLIKNGAIFLAKSPKELLSFIQK